MTADGAKVNAGARRGPRLVSIRSRKILYLLVTKKGHQPVLFGMQIIILQLVVK